MEWGLRVCRGGTLRRLVRACTSVDRLVDYLLDRAVDRLPAAARARFAEEWQDHRQHHCGWRLVWWALWVRATTPRTVTALDPLGFPVAAWARVEPYAQSLVWSAMEVGMSVAVPVAALPCLRRHPRV